MNCLNCVQHCCSCLIGRSSHADVYNKQSKQTVEEQVSSLTDFICKWPQRTFKFPQESCQITTYPQMFLETEEIAINSELKHNTKFRHYSISSSVGIVQQGVTETASTPTTNANGDLKLLTGRPDLSAGVPVLEEIIDKPSPILQFLLFYDIQQRTLTVHLHNASDLPTDVINGTSYPFVVMYLTPSREDIFESDVRHTLKNPVFNQSFEFRAFMPDDIREQTLVLKVYYKDKNSKKNTTVGGLTLPLKDIELYGTVMRMKLEEKQPEIFQKDSIGYILLSLSHEPSLALLKGMVFKATDLKKKDIFGLADPYVKINLYYKNKKISSWKSSVKYNSLVPIYNESFQFDIRGIDITSLQLEVKVIDYDRFSRDDTMGSLKLGSYVEGESERRHWKEMILNPQQQISQWHSIY